MLSSLVSVLPCSKFFHGEEGGEETAFIDQRAVAAGKNAEHQCFAS